jgi:hypothetical protein
MTKSNSTVKEETLAGGVTRGQIEAWKRQHGDIYAIDVESDDAGNKLRCYVRKPDLNIISASSKFASSDPVRSGMVVFENCWLAGDPEIKANDELKISVVIKLNELFKIREAEIKKL